MRVDAFDYELPPELIAQEPAPEREAARLLVVQHGAPPQTPQPPLRHGQSAVPTALDELVHARISELARYVPPGSLLVVNDTKVIRARILGSKEASGGKAEVFLVRPHAREIPTAERDQGNRPPQADGGSSARGFGGRAPEQARWWAMTKASKGLKPGGRVLAGPLTVTIGERGPDGLWDVLLEAALGKTLDEALMEGGRMPLPPYIKRPTSAADEARYQTVFARHDGAVAAPTAGLHLTEALLKQLREERGCEVAACTLHVGLGTFAPVITADLDDHAMHSEWFHVSTELADAVKRARERNAPVMAIGTTVVRALESAGSDDGLVHPCAEETRILIQPGYRFRVVDRLLTNFHLPKSTLMALVCAFAGTDRVLGAYRAAVEARYRFFSYGDAMLLARRDQGVT